MTLLFLFILSLCSHFREARMNSEPFGLHEGQTRSSMNLPLNLLGSQYYSVPSVPKPDSDFTRYYATVGEQTGLCMISAATSQFENDPKGIVVREKMGVMGSRLRDIYGAFVKHDVMRKNALWIRPDDWLMAVQQGEREYELRWPSLSGGKVGAGIAQIVLRAAAAGPDRSVILLSYRFDNYSRCQAEQAVPKISKQ